MTKDEKEMKEHLNKYDKDTLIELYLQAKFDEKVRIAELEREVEALLKEKTLDNCFWKQECDSLQKTVAENYKLQNQKAIECLKEVRDTCEKAGKFGFLTILTDEEFDETYIGEYVDHLRIKEIIDTKIKELEGEEDVYDK